MTDSDNGRPPHSADPADPRVADPHVAGAGSAADATERIENTGRIETTTTEEAPRAWSATGRTDTAAFEATPDTTQFAQTQFAQTQVGDGFTPIPPGPVPPPTGSGPVRAAPARRSAGKIIAAVAAALVLVVVIAAVGSELYFRSKTKDCLQNAFSNLTGTSTSVSISSKPVLLQRLSGDIPYVQVDTQDKPDAITLHARADDITNLGGTPRAGSISGTGTAPFSRVIAMSKQMTAGASNGGGATTGGTDNADPDNPLSGLMQGATIDSMTGNPTDGTVTVNSTVQVAILPIPVTTTIKPVVSGGHIKFDVVSAQAFVFGVPTDYAQNIVDSITKGMFGSLTDSLTMTELKVTAQGVDFAFNGHDVTLDGGTAGAGGTPVQCS